MAKYKQHQNGKTPNQFEIAGDAGKFYNAQAKISGKSIVTVWADEVVEPKIVPVNDRTCEIVL